MPLAVNTVKDYSTNTHILLDMIKYAILHKMFQGLPPEYIYIFNAEEWGQFSLYYRIALEEGRNIKPYLCDHVDQIFTWNTKIHRTGDVAKW